MGVFKEQSVCVSQINPVYLANPSLHVYVLEKDIFDLIQYSRANCALKQNGAHILYRIFTLTNRCRL